MKTILVTGGNGQLAQCIKSLEKEYLGLSFIYKNTSQLDITDQEQVFGFFNQNIIDWCINCAAYTSVDKAESEHQKAFNVNVLGAKNLAIACNQHAVGLFHLSTDFVFDGGNIKAYSENDQTKPLGVYGKTKLEGETEIKKHHKKYFIIRTSWLYSEYGNSFMKSMLRLAKGRQELKIVEDQIGTPTYAVDLAKVILDLIETNNKNYGLYHYSNEGVASWYDFAKAIFEISGIKINITPIPSEEFPTSAERPNFSVLSKTKIKQSLNLKIPYWRDSLKIAINNYNE